MSRHGRAVLDKRHLGGQTGGRTGGQKRNTAMHCRRLV